MRSLANFPVWKTIKLGTGLRTADEFYNAFKEAGCMASSGLTREIFSKPEFTTVTKEIEGNLVNVSNAELGFPNGATRRNTYDRAEELGLEKCPPEVGPQLRLQYLDQPMDEDLLIGMHPIVVLAGYLRVFSLVRCYDGLWLSSDFGGSGHFWRGDRRWVFVRPRR